MVKWVSHSKYIYLLTQYNGREMALGKKRLRVDYWDSAHRRTACQLHGCMFRGHPNCSITKGEEFHHKTDNPLVELYTTTQKHRTYLEDECHVQMLEMLECEWQKPKKTEPLVRQYLAETFKPLKPAYTKNVTPNEAEIIAAVNNKILFGFVRVLHPCPR